MPGKRAVKDQRWLLVGVVDGDPTEFLTGRLPWSVRDMSALGADGSILHGPNVVPTPGRSSVVKDNLRLALKAANGRKRARRVS